MAQGASAEDELLGLFIDAVRKRAQALSRQDTSAARRYLGLTNSAYNSIRAKGPAALEKLFDQTSHDDPDVRLAVAIRALETSPQKAEEVLHDLAVAQAGPASVTAEYILEAHRNGKQPWNYLGD